MSLTVWEAEGQNVRTPLWGTVVMINSTIETSNTHIDKHTYKYVHTLPFASLKLWNYPIHSSNLYSVDGLPPLCGHSTGTNTEVSQGHLQDCWPGTSSPATLTGSSVTVTNRLCLTLTQSLRWCQPPVLGNKWYTVAWR